MANSKISTKEKKMDMWFAADLHLNHPKAVTWRPQYTSVEEMNEDIISIFNSLVKPHDIVYLLGDVVMGDANEAVELMRRLNGEKVLIIGNHDTNRKIELYWNEGLVNATLWAERLKLNKRYVYLSHYPVLVENHTENPIWCVHGHTHSDNFYSDVPQNLHIGWEVAQTPFSAEDILSLILPQTI